MIWIDSSDFNWPGYLPESLSFPSNNLVLAGTDSGLIYRSNDIGKPWIMIRSVLEHKVYFLNMIDENYGIAGDENDIVLTNDGGLTWQKIIVPDSINSPYKKPYMIAKNKFFFGGNWYQKEKPNFLAYTIDNGSTWGKYEFGLNDCGFFSHNENMIWSAGWYFDSQKHQRGLIRRSINITDGWVVVLDTQKAKPLCDFRAISCSDEKNCTAVAYGRGIWRTRDGGGTWEEQTAIITNQYPHILKSVAMPSKDCIIVLTSSDDILKYFPDETSVVNNQDINLQNDIYPIPAVHTINFNGKIFDSFCNHLEIYDITGIRIKTFSYFNGNSIDISDLSTGIYFIHIIHGDGRKIIPVVVSR